MKLSSFGGLGYDVDLAPHGREVSVERGEMVTGDGEALVCKFRCGDGGSRVDGDVTVRCCPPGRRECNDSKGLYTLPNVVDVNRSSSLIP